MEYAGAVETHPPFRADEAESLIHASWTAADDGRSIRPRDGTPLDDSVAGLRHLVTIDVGSRVYDGAVAAYDPTTRELVLISARNDRVTRRALRKPRGPAGRENVIDLATHRRTISRRIG